MLKNEDEMMSPCIENDRRINVVTVRMEEADFFSYSYFLVPAPNQLFFLVEKATKL